MNFDAVLDLLLKAFQWSFHLFLEELVLGPRFLALSLLSGKNGRD